MAEQSEDNMNTQEQIGFHKGSISTLIKERDELVKMVKVVEQIMQAHINALKELGISLEETVPEKAPEQKPKKKIEDLI